MAVVIFDFDGTLTEKNGNVWKTIWQKLGYDIGPESTYVYLFKSFMAGEITHKQWCDLTCKAFKEKDFCESKLDEWVGNMSLIEGAESLIRYLYEKGYELHIVSGSIVSVIEKVLGDNTKYFKNIQANEFVFDKNGNIAEIKGTKYDFAGKKVYIDELCAKNGINPNDIVFIGNSFNDEKVSESGARTICVNPDGAKINDNTIWNKVVYIENLSTLEKEF